MIYLILKIEYLVLLCLGVAVVITGIDGVEQPQEVKRCKTFIYIGKTLLSISDFEKRVQNAIAQVKGLKRGHILGLVKVTVGT